MFPVPILKTKLNIPQMQPRIVSRPRLSSILNEGLSCKLTLISAPAGFGKTTALLEWIEHQERPVGWISLDEDDNDLIRFLTYFIAALHSTGINIGTATLEVLRSPGTHLVEKPSLESLLTALINETVEANQHVIMVLDDFHVIHDPQIIEAMEFVLENASELTHFVLASRSDPPWPLARMRARRQMNEIRAEDLRFTLEETIQFINRIMGLDLHMLDVKRLEERTEGWIAGLQMAALSLRGRENVNDFIQALTGTNRFILDFLTEEVLQQQPPEIHDFLLKTSILDQLNGPLCDRIREAENSHQLLSQIEADNLFLVAMDDHQEWYRYHHLFADLLKNTLLHDHPEQVTELHQQASLWFEENDYLESAIGHAFEAGNTQRVISLLTKYGRSIYMRGELNTLFKWFQKLSREQICSEPRLCLDYAWVIIEKSLPGEIGPFLDFVNSHLADLTESNDEDLRAIRTEMAVLEAQYVFVNQQNAQAIERCKEVLQIISLDDTFTQSVATFILVSAYNASGQVEAALRQYPQMIQLCHRAGNLMMEMKAIMDYSVLLFYQGKLNEAKALLNQTLTSTREKGLDEIPAVGNLHMGLGRILFEQNYLDEAEYNYKRSIDLLERGGGMDLVVAAHLHMTHVFQARGLSDEANARFELIRQITSGKEDHFEGDAVPAHRAMIDLRQGRLDSAEQWAKSVLVQTEVLPAWLVEFQEMVLFRVLVTLGTERNDTAYLEQALPLLHKFITYMQEKGHIRDVVRGQISLAIAQQALGDLPAAVETLQSALSLSASEGYIRSFVDGGEPMLKLLRRLRPDGYQAQYVSQLISVIQDELRIEPQFQKGEQPLIEPLSERELEVLRLLPTSLTSNEIADELYIAVSTVRSHIKNIYGKLGVHRRNEAVIQAKELGLI
jgi:LuxR family maltose regulon positive regulatory protein